MVDIVKDITVTIEENHVTGEKLVTHTEENSNSVYGTAEIISDKDLSIIFLDGAVKDITLVAGDKLQINGKVQYANVRVKAQYLDISGLAESSLQNGGCTFDGVIAMLGTSATMPEGVEQLL